MSCSRTQLSASGEARSLKLTFWLESERNSAHFAMLCSQDCRINRNPLMMCSLGVRSHYVGVTKLKIISSSETLNKLP